MREIKNQTGSIVRESTVSIRSLKLEQNLHIVIASMDTRTVEASGNILGTPETESKTIAGFFNDENLAKLNAGEKVDVNYRIRLLKPETIEKYRSVNKTDSHTVFYCDAVDHEEALEYFAKGGSLDGIVVLDTGNDELMDRKGNFIGRPTFNNYMSGLHTKDGIYDLKVLHGVLKNHPNVQGLSKAIDSVPYYNSGIGCEEHLEFWIIPEQSWIDAVNEEVKALKAKKVKYISYKEIFSRLCFENDWLGLRAAGAAKFDKFTTYV